MAHKKSSAQLDREIAEVVGNPGHGRGRTHRARHGRHVALRPWHGSEVQSLLFDKQWTPSEAKDWAQSHGYKASKVHVTDDYIRLRQFEPIAGRAKRTITFGQGIKAIIEEVR
jgi:hypothetical protein